MASPAELYAQLMTSELAFIARGEHQLQDVYAAVRSHYPQLCDDSIICSAGCKDGIDAPEWQHRVRAALQSLKRSGRVMHAGKQGYWSFR